MKPANLARFILGGLGILFLLIILLPIAASPTNVGAVLKTLPFGWWQFLKRNVPQLSYDSGLIATGVICTAGVLLMGSWFMGALYRQLHCERYSDQPTRKWKWSWSLGAYVGVWILFLVAFGAAGVVRHTTSLLKLREPWYEERLNSYIELRMADGVVEQLMMDMNQDLEKTRRAIIAEQGYFRSRKPLCEDFNIILYGNNSNQVAAYLIIPRNFKLLAKGNFAAGMLEGQPSMGSILPLTRLQETLSKMEAEYPALGSR